MAQSNNKAPLCLTVCLMHPDIGKYEVLYEFIETWEDAELLAQLAMTRKILMTLYLSFLQFIYFSNLSAF